MSELVPVIVIRHGMPYVECPFCPSLLPIKDTQPRENSVLHALVGHVGIRHVRWIDNGRNCFCGERVNYLGAMRDHLKSIGLFSYQGIIEHFGPRIITEALEKVSVSP